MAATPGVELPLAATSLTSSKRFSAGELVFAGDSEGKFIALGARTGEDLWHIQLGAAIYSAAVTYLLDGRQYVVIPAGAGLFAVALSQE